MKYKLMGLLGCLMMAAACLFTVLSEDPKENRVHQHREAQEKTQIEARTAFGTHLPLVLIDTAGQDVPGQPIWNDEGLHVGYKTAANGEKDITAHIAIVDHEETYNYADDAPDMESLVKMHIRGHTSRSFDKPSYALTLIDAAGENNPQPVMDMAAHHEWVLNGPFLDKTLFQNYMWYNIAGEIMDYAPNVRFCEVMLNGEYRGVYVMMERITTGKHCRLPLTAVKKKSVFTGYLLRLDRGKKNPLKQVDSFTQYTRRADTELDIQYPGASKLTPELSQAICRDFSKFEKALYSFDYRDPKYGYRKQVGIFSFVDFFLLNELTCNYDAGSLSTYIYKGLDGRFRLCVWDFNSACDHYQHQSMVQPQRFEMQNRLWFDMMMRDPYFTDLLIEEYQHLRKTFFSDEYLESYIDEVVDYLGPAIERNDAVWGYAYEQNLLMPEERNPRSYEEAVEQVKTFLKERTDFMDAHIETLCEYSVPSAVKPYNAVTE